MPTGAPVQKTMQKYVIYSKLPNYFSFWPICGISVGQFEGLFCLNKRGFMDFVVETKSASVGSVVASGGKGTIEKKVPIALH